MHINLRGDKTHHNIYILNLPKVPMVFKKYVFRNYSAEYPLLFAREKRKILKIIPRAKIEHVGSTSIPNLGGKGIIDIAIKTPKSKIEIYRNALKKLGYEPNPHHPDDSRRIYLEKRIQSGGKERRVHVHLTLTDNFWNSFISLRDYLRVHNKERNKYAKIKREAIKLCKGEGQRYHGYKHQFLENLQKRALKEYKSN